MTDQHNLTERAAAALDALCDAAMREGTDERPGRDALQGALIEARGVADALRASVVRPAGGVSEAERMLNVAIEGMAKVNAMLDENSARLMKAAAAELRRLAAVERACDGWKQVSKQWRGAAEIIHGMSKEDAQSLKDLRADRDRLAAEVTDWERLRDPAVLHAALLRGLPARLTPEQVWHLAADDRVRLGDLEAENVRLAAENAALREANSTFASASILPDHLEIVERAEVAALRADAERYRWLRGNCECMGANADAAIDAAKAKESSNG